MIFKISSLCYSILLYCCISLISSFTDAHQCFDFKTVSRNVYTPVMNASIYRTPQVLRHSRVSIITSSFTEMSDISTVHFVKLLFHEMRQIAREMNGARSLTEEERFIREAIECELNKTLTSTGDTYRSIRYNTSYITMFKRLLANGDLYNNHSLLDFLYDPDDENFPESLIGTWPFPYGSAVNNVKIMPNLMCLVTQEFAGKSPVNPRVCVNESFFANLVDLYQSAPEILKHDLPQGIHLAPSASINRQECNKAAASSGTKCLVEPEVVYCQCQSIAAAVPVEVPDVIHKAYMELYHRMGAALPSFVIPNQPLITTYSQDINQIGLDGAADSTIFTDEELLDGRTIYPNLEKPKRKKICEINPLQTADVCNGVVQIQLEFQLQYAPRFSPTSVEMIEQTYALLNNVLQRIFYEESSTIRIPINHITSSLRAVGFNQFSKLDQMLSPIASMPLLKYESYGTRPLTYRAIKRVANINAKLYPTVVPNITPSITPTLVIPPILENNNSFNPLWFLLFLLVIPLSCIIYGLYRGIRRAKWENRKKSIYALDLKGGIPNDGGVELSMHDIEKGLGTGSWVENNRSDIIPRGSDPILDRVNGNECIFDPIRDHQQEVEDKRQKGEEQGRRQKIEEEQIVQAQGEGLFIADSDNFLKKRDILNGTSSNVEIDEYCTQNTSTNQELTCVDTTTCDEDRVLYAGVSNNDTSDEDRAYSDSSSAHSSEHRMMKTMDHILGHYVDVDAVADSSITSEAEASSSTLFSAVADEPQIELFPPIVSQYFDE